MPYTPTTYTSQVTAANLNKGENGIQAAQAKAEDVEGWAARKDRLWLNVKEAPYNAAGNGIADDTAAIMAAVDAAEAAGGGTVYLPAGTYNHTGLNLDDVVVGVRLEGAGSATAGGGGGTTLKFTASSGNAITAKSSFGVVVRNMRILYTSTSYTGHLINLDWSAVTGDPAYFRLEGCFIGGSGASGAASCVRLNTAICCTIRGCTFGAAAIHILGQDPSYSNVIQIENCAFANHTNVSIRNPGEAWRIVGNAFQQRADGRAGAVDSTAGNTAYGLYLAGSWWGDVATNGGHWVNLLGTTLGMSVNGERFSSPGSGAGNASLRIGGIQGLNVAGCRFEGDTGISFTAAGSGGVSIVGNDFQNATAANRVVGLTNIAGYEVAGNLNVPNQVGGNIESFVNLKRAAGTDFAFAVGTAAGNDFYIRANGELGFGVAGAFDVVLARLAAGVFGSTTQTLAGGSIRTGHVGSSTPTGGASGDIKVGTNKLWVNDAGTWKSVTVA